MRNGIFPATIVRRAHSRITTRRITRAAFFSAKQTSGKQTQSPVVKSKPNPRSPQYMVIEDVEPIERYGPGSYHPATIGEQLNGRYNIVHKLGFGGYSTTWLARDQSAGSYVAIKIGVARAEPKEAGTLSLLSELHSKDSHTPGISALPPLLDVFDLEGPNGLHRCLVTAPARMSLEDAKDASIPRLFQLPVARAIVAQLIQAIALLHSRGIVHGDLHLGNVLLRLPRSLDNLTPGQLYETYGIPRSEPVERLDGQSVPKGVPSNGIVPAWFGTGSDKIPLSEAQILLIDFGESFKPAATSRYHSNTPTLLLPPEIYFLPHEPLSFSSDIWGLACAIWSILGQRPIFEAFTPTRDWMIKEQVDVLGKLPEEWWQRWQARSEYYEEDGSRNWDPVGKEWISWFQFCVQDPREKFGMEQVGEDEKEALFMLLKSMLAFKPRERLSARQVLQSDWMRGWGLPELERMKTK